MGGSHTKPAYQKDRPLQRIVASITTLEQHLRTVAQAPQEYRLPACPYYALGGPWRHGCYLPKVDRPEDSPDGAVSPYGPGALLSRERLERGDLQRIVRELARQPYEIPGSRRCHLSEKTILAWYHDYRHDGIDGLAPKTRTDRGQSRLTEAVQQAILAAKRERAPLDSADCAHARRRWLDRRRYGFALGCASPAPAARPVASERRGQ